MGDGGGGHWLVLMEWRPAGWSVCLPLLIFPCTTKSRSFLAPAHLGGPGKRAVNRLLSCGENVATLRCELYGTFLTHSGLVFIVPPCVNRRVITWCTGEPVVSVLDAKDHSSELRRTDPDDPPMSSSSENLHPRSSHATCCLRVVSRIQGNSSRMHYTPLTYLLIHY